MGLIRRPTQTRLIATLRLKGLETFNIEIVQPEGVGPFPAVVWMHSCAGVVRGARHMRDWSRRLARFGYVVAIPDSLSPRGYHNGVCGDGARVPARIRADDAYAALRHVENLPNVLADKVGLMGHSHGGWTVLAAMDRDVASEAQATAHAQHHFAAALGYSPFMVGDVQGAARRPRQSRSR